MKLICALEYVKRHFYPGYSNEFSNFLWIFRVKSTNIDKLVNGETYYECDQMNPLIQRIVVPDEPTDNILEIEFTEQEFNTWSTFCRNVTTMVYGELNI